MKITLLKENLKKAINLVQKTIVQNPTLPILKNILIRKEKNKLILIGTDLELAIKSWLNIKADSDEKIETTIPASAFSSFINNLFEEKINLNIEKSQITIQTQNLKAKFQGLDAQDFPIIPKVKKINKFEIDAQILKNSFESVINASSLNSSRPEISGVLFYFNGQELILAATDSFRLAQKTISSKYFKTDLKENFKALIPLKTVGEFIRVVELVNPEAYIDIFFDQNQVLFDFSETQIISRLVNANFPEYQEIIPKHFTTKISTSKEKIISSIKISSIFSSQINDLKIKVPENLKNLEFYTQDASLGENKVLVEAKIQGKGLEISFNFKYLLDGLKPIKDDKIFIGFNENNSPSLIRSEKDETYIYILMPIKI